MIKKKDKDLSIGPMEENMREVGRMENNTELVPTHLPAERLSKESGRKARDCTGFQTNENTQIA